MNQLTNTHIKAFVTQLKFQEKTPATIKKYLLACTRFYDWLKGRPVTKEIVCDYKAAICRLYAPSTVNGILCAINALFTMLGWTDCKARSIRNQRTNFLAPNAELTRMEYRYLLIVAETRKKRRLSLLMQTLCATGIRISELSAITVEAAKYGIAELNCKGKIRKILLPTPLCNSLLAYCRSQLRTSGPVFVTRNGTPLDRSNIWHDMKQLCKGTNISPAKIFPHNLRHLFARIYYNVEKDIVRLADILGHSSIDTTRIYTIESGTEHRKQLEKLGLIRLP